MGSRGFIKRASVFCASQDDLGLLLDTLEDAADNLHGVHSFDTRRWQSVRLLAGGGFRSSVPFATGPRHAPPLPDRAPATPTRPKSRRLPGQACLASRRPSQEIVVTPWTGGARSNLHKGKDPVNANHSTTHEPYRSSRPPPPDCLGCRLDPDARAGLRRASGRAGASGKSDQSEVDPVPVWPPEARSEGSASRSASIRRIARRSISSRGVLSGPALLAVRPA